ncbi:hypothetical protein J5N97_010575 [Dioscorea zingiberensis]|uniref:Nuclear transcription factor Y subunit n=1 Tax=Dioscorea zingiberensis TaxID=325984 RepID=A0A9D5HMJ2_9LILI|nr:hypothetical protein J5N97_010575 [Dioscorea zingiberensis]
MGTRSKSANSVDPVIQDSLPSTISSQAWWRGPGFGATVPPTLLESVSKSASMANPGGDDVTKCTSQSQVHDKVNGSADIHRQMQTLGIPTDGICGQEHQAQPFVSSAVPTVMTEYHVPHTQLELGQSIACAAYPYADPYGLMSAYGNPPMVHPHLIGMPHTRMPLPLEMTEEPVYVNAKQYHGILRRRQSRAKAELEKKLIKVRKPYLHESRHQHAMRRARGCGGRFLNTKKNDGNAANSNPENTGNTGNPISASISHELEGQMQQPTYTNTSDGYPQPAFQLSAFHSMSGERIDEGDCSGQQRGGILVNQPSNRAVTIQ